MIAIGTRVATRGEVPAGTPLIERVCSYCRRTLGWVVCVPQAHGEKSHGACDPCLERELGRMRAATMLVREYTLEIGAAGEEPATQAAAPTGGLGRDDNAPAGAAKQNASEALRGPVSSFFPAVSGADESALLLRTVRGSTENAGGGQVFFYHGQNGEHIIYEHGN